MDIRDMDHAPAGTEGQVHQQENDSSLLPQHDHDIRLSIFSHCSHPFHEEEWPHYQKGIGRNLSGKRVGGGNRAAAAVIDS